MWNTPDIQAAIKETRKKLKLSQEELGRRTGLSHATIERIESGKSKNIRKTNWGRIEPVIRPYMRADPLTPHISPHGRIPIAEAPRESEVALRQLERLVAIQQAIMDDPDLSPEKKLALLNPK
jgi:transcriptional regulator with XRE-family HTH domain